MSGTSAKDMAGIAIEDEALDGMSVAPPDPDQEGQEPGSDRLCRGDAGTDASIAERLERNPENREAQLDAGIDESMDASDPPSTTRPDQRDRPGGN